MAVGQYRRSDRQWIKDGSWKMGDGCRVMDDGCWMLDDVYRMMVMRLPQAISLRKVGHRAAGSSNEGVPRKDYRSVK